MKNKKFKKEQLSLEQCVKLFLDALDKEDSKNLVLQRIHDVEYGRWIRNECGLWEHGTERCVADIVTEYKAGRLKSVYLDNNLFTHPQIPFDLKNIQRMDVPVDSTLAHPDNCSAVIIEAVLQKMDPNYGR